MKLISMVVLGATAAAGFVAARTLLDRPEAPQSIPQPLQQPTAAAHGRLHRARARVADAMAAASTARHDAEQELREDYLRRTGRLAPASPTLPDIREAGDTTGL